MENHVTHYEKSSEAFVRLLKIMDELRLKCPWDQKQTIETLRTLTLEEVFELSDAILTKDHKEIAKELGDVLLHIVFYAKIGSEQDLFNLDQVINGLCEKLIHRHPHIYGDVVVEGEADVKRNWEQLKIKEGNPSVLGGVPSSLPALIKAQRIQEKAAGVGFDWNHPQQVWEKVLEEIKEFQQEILSNDSLENHKMEEEFGDILFSLVNYARFKKINPDNALEKANKKFIKRFNFIEQEAKAQEIPLNAKNIDFMEEQWNKAKALSF